MATTIQNNFRIRKNFAKIQKIIDIPNLIDIQKHSYDKFLQFDKASEQREDTGLQVSSSRLPHQGLQRDQLAGVRQLPPGEAEVRRR